MIKKAKPKLRPPGVCIGGGLGKNRIETVK